MVYNGGIATGVVIPVGHISGSSPLYHLKRVGQILSVRARDPHCRAVLQVWPHSEEAKGAVTLLHCCVNVVVP